KANGRIFDGGDDWDAALELENADQKLHVYTNKSTTSVASFFDPINIRQLYDALFDAGGDGRVLVGGLERATFSEYPTSGVTSVRMGPIADGRYSAFFAFDAAVTDADRIILEKQFAEAYNLPVPGSFVLLSLRRVNDRY